MINPSNERVDTTFRDRSKYSVNIATSRGLHNASNYTVNWRVNEPGNEFAIIIERYEEYLYYYTEGSYQLANSRSRIFSFS